MGKREKSPGNKGKKFNIILSVIALILVVAVGGVTTYSWIEQHTNMNVNVGKGNIKDTPENYVKYFHTVTVGRNVENSYIQLNQFADFADGVALSQLTSADGKTFFYQTSNNQYKKLDANDKSVSYLSFDFDVISIDSEKTDFYFDSETLRFVYGTFVEGQDNSNANSIRMSVTTTIDDVTKTKIFAPNATPYTSVKSDGTTTTEVTPEVFSEYYQDKSSIFTIPGKGKAKVTINIWLEGNDATTGENVLVAKNDKIDMVFQLNTTWYNANSKFIYLYDGTADQILSDCTSGTYTTYDANGNMMGTADQDLINVYDGNNQIKQTAIIKDLKGVARVEFKLKRTGSKETLTYYWDATGKADNETEVYYTITDYTKDPE